MAIDPSFGRSWERFGPVSSFQEPVSPPINGPFDAPVYALPCVNNEWLRLLLGAAMQLENPSTWDPALSDSGRLLAVQRAQELRAGLAELAACVNPVVSLAYDCTDGLVATLADGSNVPVTGWNANFCTCVSGCIAPTVPFQPPGNTAAQNACNEASFLAQTVLQQMVALLAAAKAAGDDVNKWIQSLAAEFAIAAVWLETATQVLSDAFVTSIAFPLTDLEAIRDDTAWWDQVKCCFYSSFLDNPPSYVTAGNLNVIANCVGFTPFPAHPWVPTMIGNLIHNLGLSFWQAVQAQGSLVNADCSDCATWCRYLDFRAGPQGYSAVVGGIWVSGAGWRGTFVPADGAMSVHITEAAWPSSGRLQSIDITWGADGSTGATNPELGRDMAVFLGASLQVGVTITPNTAQTLITQRYTFASVTADNVSIVIGENSSGSGIVTIQDITFRGTGPNPFGASNCV